MPDGNEQGPDRKRVRSMIKELRSRLNAWDPIGFGPPLDEYDCMHGPILRALRHETSADALAGVLRDELVGHFGLGADEDFGERAVATELVDWYRGWKTPPG